MSRLDMFNLFAVRKFGMPEGWRWYELEVAGDGSTPRKHGAFVVTGAVPSVLFKSGPNKGKVNWSKAANKAQLVITVRDLDAFQLEWEAETGDCHRCYGEGKTIASSGVNGTTYRDCKRCNATGRASTIAGEVTP